MKKINNLQDVEKYLSKFVPKNIGDNFFAETALLRVKNFVKLLGSPQKKMKVVHIAGTSGKGSTATIISNVLQGLGFQVGLQVSPHLLDIRERCQVNNELLSEEKFIKYFLEIIPVIEKVAKTKFGKLTYFEIITGLSLYIFQQEKVDYAVIETGLGGTYDASNIIDDRNKIAVLTKIGKDHTEILGKTIEEIALQKIGIVHWKNKVFSTKQNNVVKKVFDEYCLTKKAKIFYVKDVCQFELNLLGDFQKKNCALALAVIKFLSKRDGFNFNRLRIQKSLAVIEFPGRFEIKEIGNKEVIFDGAHNTQKMTAFLQSLRKKYPKTKFHFLLAFKKKKDYEGLLKLIIKMASAITITNFQYKKQDLETSNAEINILTKILDKNFYKNYNIISDPIKAFENCLLQDRIGNKLVVTGSLYLISEIYKYYEK